LRAVYGKCAWLAGWPVTGRRQGGRSQHYCGGLDCGLPWWRSGNIKRTQNVSEYMLVLALCLVFNLSGDGLSRLSWKRNGCLSVCQSARPRTHSSCRLYMATTYLGFAFHRRLIGQGPVCASRWYRFNWRKSLSPPVRHHLSYDDCLQDKRENYQNCSVLCCVRQLSESFSKIRTCTCTHMRAVLESEC